MADSPYADLDLEDVDDVGSGSSGVVATPTTVFLGVTSLLATLFVYDYAIDSSLVAFKQYDWPLTLAVLALIIYGGSPFVRDRTRAYAGLVTLASDTRTAIASVVVGVTLVVGLVGPFLLSEPLVTFGAGYQPPLFVSVSRDVVTDCVGTVRNGRCFGSLAYPLGTARGGFDILNWVVHGLRVTVAVALVAGLVIVVVGSLVGGVAGFVGGRTDELLMRYVDVQQVVPGFLVYIVLRLVLEGSLFALVLVFGLLNWGGTARLVRSEARAIAETGYISAARAAGASRWRIMRSHVFPNVAGAALTSAGNRASTLILAEASLAFLNLGPPQVHSLGRLAAMDIDLFPTFPWISTIPVVVLAIVALSLGVVGEGIRSAFDPRAE